MLEAKPNVFLKNPKNPIIIVIVIVTIKVIIIVIVIVAVIVNKAPPFPTQALR